MELTLGGKMEQMEPQETPLNEAEVQPKRSTHST
jgi:hypothetical protein